MMKNNKNHSEVFSELYESNFWGGKNSPDSGTGSTETAALPYVEIVKNFIETHSIESVLDIGHGDWGMWGNYKFDNVQYVGIDVYETLSKKLNLKLGNKSRSYIHLNAVSDFLPSADLCITKDVLQHLPIEDIKILLRKLCSFKYLVICNDIYKFDLKDSIKAIRRFISIRERVEILRRNQNPFFLKLKRTNCEIDTGGHRCINLNSRPFKTIMHNHKLLHTVDFVGKDTKRPNIVKRIYIYEKL
jgi:hypothetical protein